MSPGIKMAMSLFDSPIQIQRNVKRNPKMGENAQENDTGIVLEQSWQFPCSGIFS